MEKHTDQKSFGRILIYFPIVHTASDMGTLKESVQRETYRRRGRTEWNRKMNAIEQFWTKIEQIIESLTLSYSQVRIYQDGLPICGHEDKIVMDLAKAGSRNHHLILNLMDKGAILMGTESSELLLKEYETAKQYAINLIRLMNGEIKQGFLRKEISKLIAR